ncbi:MAG: hypothetical protein A2172_02475 [Candidatus Woykebacteria bacterium RBG_13_40_15]|uniref:Uncharacterized protein n=1 Tax=Candidatus Woykebacteria bacterium RBG_13_40_15 TaxID=1802593 RepID=A0A1G1W6G6_9BACT|nr:MAG: hypothetical protein A2172_02475 [Candidatus Woykebacteria bacterium RBG_13_40_15]
MPAGRQVETCKNAKRKRKLTEAKAERISEGPEAFLLMFYSQRSLAAILVLPFLQKVTIKS